MNAGRFPLSVLHPDNQQALAHQGYYDNYSSTDDSITNSELQAKLRRKQPKELSAGSKRKLFRTSHGSWNLVEDDESESYRFSCNTSPMSGSSSALMSFGSSSDGGLTPSWNLHSGKIENNDKILKETNTNVFMFPEIAEKGPSNENNSAIDNEIWYTPVSSPSEFDKFDEIVLNKTKSPSNSAKDAWSSSTLLDHSLNVSVGDDCVFENEAKVEGCGNGVEDYENRVSSSSNEITFPNTLIGLEAYKNDKIISTGTSILTNNISENGSTNFNATNTNIKPILSQRRDSFTIKKSVSFKDDDDFSEILQSEKDIIEHSEVPVSNVIDSRPKDLQVKEIVDLEQVEAIREITASHDDLHVENVETIVTSPIEEAVEREITENHINEVTVHTTEYQIEIIFGDIISSKPCVTEKFRINNDINEQIPLDQFYDENKVIHQVLNVPEMDSTNCPLNNTSMQSQPRQYIDTSNLLSIRPENDISCDITEEESGISEQTNPELSQEMTSKSLDNHVKSHTNDTNEKVDSNDIVLNSIIPKKCSSKVVDDKSPSRMIQRDDLCNKTELSERLQNETVQSEDSNNNCAVTIGQVKFKSDQSKDDTSVRQKTIGCDSDKMAELDQSESLLQNGKELALPVDLEQNFLDSSSIFAQVGLSGRQSEQTQSPTMVCGHSLDSSSINGASSRSPPHLPERRRLFFTSHHCPPLDESSNTDFLSQLNSELANQPGSLNVLARTSSAQSDSSGFADAETDNMLDIDLKTLSTYMGSSGDSDMTLASSINTVLTQNLQDSNQDPVESSPLSVSTPSKSLNSQTETMDKCIGTDIQGLDLIFQVLTPSGEIYHPEQGEETPVLRLSTSEVTDSDLRCENDTDFGFSIWNDKSCRFHESSYCIIPTLYGSDFSLANNDNDTSPDLNGNPTPQKSIVSRYYVDMSPRKYKSKLETSAMSLKVEAGKVSLQESENSSDSVMTTRLLDNLKSFHDELFDLRDDAEMSQDESIVDEIERDEQNFSCRGDRMEIHDIPEQGDYSLCNFSSRESPFGMSTPKNFGKMFSSPSAHELSVLNLSVGTRPDGHMTFSQCQAASTPEVKVKTTEEDEAAIFEYQKLASLINQPTVTKRRGLNTVTTPRYSGPTHSDRWRVLQRDQRLVEENRLMQQAVDRYKMELRHLENSFNAHYSKVYDMMTEEERDEIEELQLLRAEVYKEVCLTEKLILGRGTNLSQANQSVKHPLASLDVVHQMIELLKEQMYQRTVVLDLDSSMDQLLDTSSSSLPLSPWEEEVSDLRDEVRREQRIQQQELERSFEGLKVSLVEEVKNEIHNGTQSLYQELEAKDKKITAMQSEIQQLRRQSLQTDMLPPR